MTSVQLNVMALVSVIEIPCLANILAISTEFGWKKLLAMIIAEIGMAIVIWGSAYKLLILFM